jgi:diacylglycerol kinase family enzyme
MMGPAAYFFAAPQVLTSEPFTCRIAMDDGQAVSTKASIALVGNVGSVMGQIQVLPDALPDDGVLDLVVASPRSITDWARIAGRVISGSDDPAELARATGSSVTIEVSGDPVEYQLDGDTIGSCNTLSARVVPSALRVSVPSQVADPAPPGDPSDGHHSSPDA